MLPCFSLKHIPPPNRNKPIRRIAPKRSDTNKWLFSRRLPGLGHLFWNKVAVVCPDHYLNANGQGGHPKAERWTQQLGHQPFFRWLSRALLPNCINKLLLEWARTAHSILWSVADEAGDALLPRSGPGHLTPLKWCCAAKPETTFTPWCP